VQHSSGGYLLVAMLSMQWVFDYKPPMCSGVPPTWLDHRHSYVAYGRWRWAQRK